MTPARALSLGLLLTATAGFIDAIGFVVLGGFYTSFMSGNTTQLGAGIAGGWSGALLLPIGLVSLFFTGAVIGSLAAQSSTRRGPVAALGVVLTAIAASALTAAAGFGAPTAMLGLAAAAGAQNAVLVPIGAARLGTTFVTGTLFAAGQDLAAALRRSAPPGRWLQHLMVWGALCGGAVLGALAYRQWQVEALIVPAIIYAATLIWFALRPTRL